MHKRKEKGQVIILLAAGIIMLLGFTALAIDGARIFSEKRNLQGVADTAALTAAAYIGQFEKDVIKSNFYTGLQIEPNARAAALQRIHSNGYTDAAYDPFGTNDWLKIEIIPVNSSDQYTPYRIMVTMISEVKPIFAQLIYHDPILVNVYTEVIIWPKMNIGYGNAIFATAGAGDRRIEFIGNGELDITGAGVFANSTSDQAVYISGSSSSDIDGNVATVGDIYINDEDLMNSDGVISGAEVLPFPDITPPQDCSDLGTSVEKAGDSGETIHTAGRIAEKLVITGGVHVFESGFYCVMDTLQITGGEVYSADGGVLFYFPNPNTSFLANGGVIDLKAGQDGSVRDSEGEPWDGMLIFIKKDNIGIFSVVGNAGSHLEGTIYAPGPPQNENSPKCTLGGSGITDTYNVQFVCYSIQLIGNAGLFMEYNEDLFFETPVTLALEE